MYALDRIIQRWYSYCICIILLNLYSFVCTQHTRYCIHSYKGGIDIVFVSYHLTCIPLYVTVYYVCMHWIESYKGGIDIVFVLYHLTCIPLYVTAYYVCIG